MANPILVTGATGGIGQPLCERLARAGYSLILAARDEAKLKTVTESLARFGEGPHAWMPVDMASDESVAAFADEMTRRGVLFDGVVLMPPQLPRTAESLLPSAAWREVFQASFIGPLALLKAAIDRMQPDPAGGRRCKIVIVSAVSSVQLLGNYATSGVLRAAWLAEAKALAFSLGRRGIHVNTISLGGVMTPGYSVAIGKRATESGMSFMQKLAEETANIPLGKYGAPEEVAVAIESLLSGFSDHITGANILCDGGFTRSY